MNLYNKQQMYTSVPSPGSMRASSTPQPPQYMGQQQMQPQPQPGQPMPNQQPPGPYMM